MTPQWFSGVRPSALAVLLNIPPQLFLSWFVGSSGGWRQAICEPFCHIITRL